MRGWICWLLATSLLRVGANHIDFLHRFRTNLVADFASLNLNSNALRTLADIEAADVCQDALNVNKVLHILHSLLINAKKNCTRALRNINLSFIF